MAPVTFTHCLCIIVSYHIKLWHHYISDKQVINPPPVTQVPVEYFWGYGPIVEYWCESSDAIQRPWVSSASKQGSVAAQTIHTKQNLKIKTREKFSPWSFFVVLLLQCSLCVYRIQWYFVKYIDSRNIRDMHTITCF